MNAPDESEIRKHMESVTSELNENIKRVGMLPVFADSVSIATRIKGNKKGEMQGFLEIIFMDSTKNQPLGRFVLDSFTAGDLERVLQDSLKKLNEILKKIKIPQQQSQTKEQQQSSYR